MNFGTCKGETFDRVLIFPNGPLTNFVMKGTVLNSPEKYYVGVTRPRYSIALVLKTVPKTLRGYKHVEIDCMQKIIKALQYIPD